MGRRLVEMLAERGAKRVVSFDVAPKPKGAKDAINGCKIDYVQADLTKYDSVLEAFTGCALLAHYVLPAPPKSWRAALQSEFKKAEMAQKEGYWMDQLNARVTGYNKKSEGLCMD